MIEASLSYVGSLADLGGMHNQVLIFGFNFVMSTLQIWEYHFVDTYHILWYAILGEWKKGNILGASSSLMHRL